MRALSPNVPIESGRLYLDLLCFSMKMASRSEAIFIEKGLFPSPAPGKARTCNLNLVLAAGIEPAITRLKVECHTTWLRQSGGRRGWNRTTGQRCIRPPL